MRTHTAPTSRLAVTTNSTSLRIKRVLALSLALAGFATITPACGGAESSSETELTETTGQLNVERSAELAATPDDVWALIGPFEGIAQWHPAIAETVVEGSGSPVVGSIRVLTLGDGATLREELLEHSENERRYRYSILEGPLPVVNYVSTLEVRGGASSTSAVFTWSATFDPAEGADPTEVENLIGGIYDAGFAALGETFASN